MCGFYSAFELLYYSFVLSFLFVIPFKNISKK